MKSQFAFRCPAAFFVIISTAAAAPNVTHILQSTGTCNLTTASWTNGTPGPGTAGDLVTASTSADLSLDGNLTIGVIKVTNSGAFTINGGAAVLTLDATGLTAGNMQDIPGVAFIGQREAAGAITLDSTVTLASDLDIGATAPNSLVTIDGALTASTPVDLNFRANGNSAIDNSASIGMGGSDVAISNLGTGTGATTLSGQLGTAVTSVTQASASSALTLAGSNSSYAGPVDLFDGTLRIGSSTALGNGLLTVSGGTTLDTSSGAQVLGTGNAQDWEGDFTFAGSANLTFGNGPIMLLDDVAVTVGGQSLVENGAIGDDGFGFALTKAGSGTLTLRAANTYSGATTVNAGSLTLGGGGGSILLTSGIAVNGSGTLILDNSTANADRVAHDGTVTLSQNGRLALTPSAAADTTENIGVLNLALGDDIVTVSSTTSRVTTLQADSLERSNFSTALIRGSALGSQATNVGRLRLDNAGGLTQVGNSSSSTGLGDGSARDLKIVPYLIGDTTPAGTGSSFVTYDTASGFRPLGAGETTVLTAGYATQPIHENVRGGGLTLANSIAVNSLLLDTAGTLNGSNTTLQVDSGALATASVPITVGSGFTALTLGNGSANEGIVTVIGNTTTIAAPLGVTGSGGLTKAGAGTLVLTGNNPYLGKTTINQGAIQVGNGGATGNLGNNSQEVALNGGNLAINRTGTFTMPNNLTGVGSLLQNLAGSTLILSGNNSHSGATTLTNGATLQAVANGGNTIAGISSALSPESGLTLFSNGVGAANVPVLKLRADSDTTFLTGTVTPNGVQGDVAIVGSVQGAAATIDVNQATVAGANKILTLGDVVIDNTVGGAAGNTVLNVTGGNGYTLRIGALLSSNRGPNGQGATFSVNPTSADLIIGSITGSTNNASTVTFTGSATTTVTGSISQNLTGLPRGITVNLNQIGKVNLNGSNTFGTGFAIANGTTVLNHGHALGLSGTTPTLGTTTASSNNATLLLGGTNAAGTNGGITLSRSIRAQNNDTGILTLGGQNSSGFNIFTGTITLGATTNVGKSVTLTATTGGEVVFDGPLVKNGTDTTAGITVGGGGNDGVVTLTNANTFAGPTQVASGTLYVDSFGSLAAGSAVTVASGATLGGTGITNGSVTAAGTIVPGRDGIGTLTTGAAAINGTVEIEIDGPDSDRLVSTGNLNLTGATLVISESGAGFSNPPYVIAQAASVTGHFASVPPGFVVTYSATEVTLVQPAGGSYVTWASANGIPGQPAAGDFDFDGLTNVMEYALGKNPTLSSQPPGTFVNRVLTLGKGANAAANGDVAYTIETSTTLEPGSWTPVAPLTNDQSTISYQIPLSGPRKFARLKVILAP